MARTVYGKLVRDKIPETIQADGCRVTTRRILDPREFAGELRKKLTEEVQEYQDVSTWLAGPPRVADRERQQRLLELCDILEVVEALAVLDGFTTAGLWKRKAEKKRLRGGFTDRVFLVEVESP